MTAQPPTPPVTATPHEIGQLGEQVAAELNRLADIVNYLSLMTHIQVNRTMSYLVDRYGDGTLIVDEDHDEATATMADHTDGGGC